MNRRDRRRQKINRQRTVTLKKSETTEHATVMVMNNPEWTPFEEATWMAHLSRVGEKMFLNSRYQVTVYPPAPAKASAEGWPRVIHLCFKHIHNIAITDFRDFQRIKNELVDPAAFTFQIYPDEAHLIDGANQYHLWALVPDGYPDEKVPAEDWPTLPYGFFDGRMVTDVAPKGGRQRTFETPPDTLEEDRKRVENMIAGSEE
jgi:hypothetical protein